MHTLPIEHGKAMPFHRNGETDMTKREIQIKEMEQELHLPLTGARRKDLTAMLTHAKRLLRR